MWVIVYKMWLKNLKEDKGKKNTIIMTGNMQPHKGANFLQNSLQIQCNKIQNFKGFFFCLSVEFDKLSIKFTWQFQGSRIVKANKLEEQGMRNSFKDFLIEI